MDDDIKAVGESVQELVSRLKEITRDISLAAPVIREELSRMDDATFWKKVCHSVIADTLEEVPEGTHLFQCSWSNREYFDNVNNPRHYMLGNDKARPERMKEDRAEIWVNIARVARFSMACPYAGTMRCPLRNFRFSNEERRRETI